MSTEKLSSIATDIFDLDETMRDTPQEGTKENRTPGINSQRRAEM
jgi:hypothetical protein